MLKIFKERREVLQAAAEYFVETAEEAIGDYGKFTVALSGGSSPKELYELLASEPFRSKVHWSKVYFFFGDERNVPGDHPDSNALMVKKALFDPLNISPKQIFAVDTSLEPKKAAAAYQQVIEQHFSGEAIFDLILLGLGDNSHTASLFPNTEVLDVKEAGVKEVFLQDQNVYRITLTAPLINQAKRIAFLVFGDAKAKAVHHILEEENDCRQYPAQLIQPASGDVIWFLDEAAAAMLNDTSF
jgi:6-phosphogluconolactonase